MKTPTNELIERLVNFSNSTYFNGKKTDCDIIDKIINIVRNEYIKKEKEIILKAWEDGSKSDNGFFGSAEDYYNSFEK